MISFQRFERMGRDPLRVYILCHFEVQSLEALSLHHLHHIWLLKISEGVRELDS